MSLKVAMLISEGQINVKTLDFTKKTYTSKIIDSTSLQDEIINLLLIDNDLDLSGLESVFTKETKFYPIVPINGIGMTKENFESFDYNQLFELYTKVSPRWILNNNLTTVEQLYPLITHLKTLWVQDRNSFFEELWFHLKSNLATTDLSIIFNDLKEPTEKQKEKGDKPSLCRSYVQGLKLPNLFAAKEAQEILMKEYDKEFSQIFNITEYDSDRGHLVACAKIGLSPILIMAKLPQLNQMQKSILNSLFNGLQEA